MDTFGYNMPRWGFRTHTRQITRDKPSPLRIVKRGISASREASSRSSSRRTDRSANSDMSYQQQDASLSGEKNRSMSNVQKDEAHLGDDTSDLEDKCHPSFRDRTVSWDINDVGGLIRQKSSSPPQGLDFKTSLRVKRIRPRKLKGRNRIDGQET